MNADLTTANYLHRNLHVAKAVGVVAGLYAIKDRAIKRKDMPLWLFEALGELNRRATELITPLVDYRDQIPAPLNPKPNPPPCVNSDEQQETTHREQAPPHVHEWNPLAALPNSDWQDVCVTCGAHRIVKSPPMI